MTNLNFLSFLGFTIFILSLPTSIFVYFNNPKKENNISLSLFNLSTSFWSLGLFFSFISEEYNQALFWARFLNTSAILIQIFFLHFVYSFLEISREKKIFLITSYAVVLGYFFSAILFPELFVKDVSPKLEFKFYPNPGYLYYFFPLLLTFFVSISLTQLYLRLKENTGQKKIQLQYLLIASIVGFLGGSTTFFMVFDIPIYPYGLLGVPALNLIIAYTIIKHKLLDLKFAIIRLIIKTMTTSFFILTYILLLRILSFVKEKEMINLSFSFFIFISVVFIIFVIEFFPFVYNYFKTFPSLLIFKEYKTYTELSKIFSSDLDSTLTRKDFLQKLSSLLYQYLGIKNLKLYTKTINQDQSEFVLLDSFSGEENFNYHLNLSLINELELEKKILLFEDIDFRLRNVFKEEKIHAIIPCIHNGKINGVITFGIRVEKTDYSFDELMLFDFLKSYLGLILDRLTIYSASIERLESLEKSLTLMEFIREYIHEIKNPIAVLKGYSSLENVGLKELKDVVYVQSNHLNKLTTSMLNISNEGRTRIFQPVNLNQIIDSVLALFPNIRKKKNFSEIPMIYGDAEELQILFTNLFKNAKDAMENLESNLKILTVQTESLNQNRLIHVEVTDCGVGIAKEHLPIIWEKFASIGKKGGTGLGMPIIKRIVDQHFGAIDIDSKLGLGTTIHLFFSSME